MYELVVYWGVYVISLRLSILPVTARGDWDAFQFSPISALVPCKHYLANSLWNSINIELVEVDCSA